MESQKVKCTALMAATLVLDLADVDASMLPIVGGKAANLGELIRAGLARAARRLRDHRSVPAGRGLRRDRLRCPRGRAGRGLDTGGRARRAKRCSPRPFPRPSRRPSREAYARLGHDVPVAVRSSATAEDLPFASFAGPAGHLPPRHRRATRCSTRCAAAGRRCGPTAPWPTAPATASTIGTSGSPSSCSGWWTPRSPACCSPPTRSPAGGVRRSSTPAPASARPWSRARSTPTTSWSTPTSGRDPRAAARRQARSRCARCPAAARSTSSAPAGADAAVPHRRPGPRAGRARRSRRGALRRAPGHRVGDRRATAGCGSPRPGPSRRCSRCRRPRSGVRHRDWQACASTSASASRRGCTGRSRRWAWPPSGC